MILGHYILTETKIFDVAQEFAGAVRQIEVGPGEYPIEVRKDRWGGRYVAIPMPGTQICNNWFGSNVRIDEERKPATYTAQPYLYQVRDRDTWFGGRFVLGDNVEIKERPFEFDGETRIAKDVYVDGEKVDAR